jgi:hypothetical protein
MNKIVNEIQNLQNMEKNLFNKLNSLTLNKKHNYNLIGNFDIGGVQNLPVIGNSTIDKCKTSCDLNSNCLGFVYNTNNKNCILKTNTSSSNRIPISFAKLYSKGTLISNTQEEQRIINEINNLSNVRKTLLKTLNNDYKNLMLDVSSSGEETTNQLKVTKIVEEELNRMKTNVNKLIEDKNNKIRKVEVNSYYSDKYNSYLKITTTILLFCVPFLVLAILSKFGLLPSNVVKIIISILLVLLIVLVLYNLFDINLRNNMNFDEYNTYLTSNSSTQNVKPITGSSLLSTLKKDLKGLKIGTCIGSNCCSKGTTFDKKTNKCV